MAYPYLMSLKHNKTLQLQPLQGVGSLLCTGVRVIKMISAVVLNYAFMGSKN